MLPWHVIRLSHKHARSIHCNSLGELVMMVETVLSRAVRVLFAGGVAVVATTVSGQEAEPVAARI
jgi:hypothetical protein